MRKILPLLPLVFLATVVAVCWGDEMPTFTDIAPEDFHIECDLAPGTTSGPCRTAPNDKIIVPDMPRPGCYVTRVMPSLALEFLREVPCQ